jgi:hypothetical protein
MCGASSPGRNDLARTYGKQAIRTLGTNTAKTLALAKRYYGPA